MADVRASSVEEMPLCFLRTRRTLSFVLTLELLAGQAPRVFSAELQAWTLDAFSRYVQATETRIARELSSRGGFLYVEKLPAPQRAQVEASLRRGEIFVVPLKTQDASGHEIHARGGLIHHWMGAVFIPGATLAQVMNVAHDYNHHQDIFKPEVVRSRLISRNGNDFKIFYRLRKHKIITVTLNTEHEVHYTPLDSTHSYSRSIATRIAEVENAGQPNEREKPIGHDGGFLWRINSYWRFEERDRGVYLECESISLTRDIPTGLGWIIRPFTTDIPKESLEMSLGSTRLAVTRRIAAGRGQ